MAELSIEVNGRSYRLEVSPNSTLLEVIRDRLGLTGTKQGCGQGDCGACTVLVDGEPVCSCLVLALQAEGRKVTTVEALATDHELHQLQVAFIEKGAIQCGYCTPGFLMSAKALLDREPSPSREQILEALSGNLCRCTGYLQIVEAVQFAAEMIRKGGGGK